MGLSVLELLLELVDLALQEAVGVAEVAGFVLQEGKAVLFLPALLEGEAGEAEAEEAEEAEAEEDAQGDRGHGREIGAEMGNDKVQKSA